MRWGLISSVPTSITLVGNGRQFSFPQMSWVSKQCLSQLDKRPKALSDDAEAYIGRYDSVEARGSSMKSIR
jgi:hypothetical protein